MVEWRWDKQNNKEINIEIIYTCVIHGIKIIPLLYFMDDKMKSYIPYIERVEVYTAEDIFTFRFCIFSLEAN